MHVKFMHIISYHITVYHIHFGSCRFYNA